MVLGQRKQCEEMIETGLLKCEGGGKGWIKWAKMNHDWH